MSTQDFQSGNAALPQVEKPRFNVYTMMLIISLIFIILAIVMLYNELALYGSYPWWNTSEATV
ncbi:MAG: hypothetical protein KDA55_18935 [Planctomycetales bacterium]|nr:hypothetical protein [Planctomycetales bacterium]MCA9206163.1 hypothetical protein [Planctomycetales bacterium]MCA9210444.1 hypothetical protein [Planctomycetales bacterium]MCA9220553.1 hypothetical protein [Planctomycetales bacterium]MCA9226965.1 hypothetical protein [Planctomycetales bacterium]